MREIILTQNQVALVDDEIFEELNQFKWYAHKGCNTFYARRMLPRVNGKQGVIRMHHVIIGKPPKGFEVDHKNGDGLWNLRNNLRFVTKRQNGQNRKNQNTSSQYPGVYWCKAGIKWMAYIRIDGVRKHLGLFTNEFEAFTAYKQVVESLGETIVGDR